MPEKLLTHPRCRAKVSFVVFNHDEFGNFREKEARRRAPAEGVILSGALRWAATGSGECSGESRKGTEGARRAERRISQVKGQDL